MRVISQGSAQGEFFYILLGERIGFNSYVKVRRGSQIVKIFTCLITYSTFRVFLSGKIVSFYPNRKNIVSLFCSACGTPPLLSDFAYFSSTVRSFTSSLHSKKGEF